MGAAAAPPAPGAKPDVSARLTQVGGRVMAEVWEMACMGSGWTVPAAAMRQTRPQPAWDAGKVTLQTAACHTRCTAKLHSSLQHATFCRSPQETTGPAGGYASYQPGTPTRQVGAGCMPTCLLP